jgi:N-acyl homoserine lactone hydrolase
MVDGDVDLYPGLRLLETSGHTTGHQSVLVSLPQTGWILLAIDAVMLARLFVPDRLSSPADENADELRASTVKLLDLVRQLDIKLVVFGHDGVQWRDLRLAPSFYS